MFAYKTAFDSESWVSATNRSIFGRDGEGVARPSQAAMCLILHWEALDMSV
jgi:hypothetical protein